MITLLLYATSADSISVDDFESVADAFDYASSHASTTRQISFSHRTYTLNATQQSATHVLQLSHATDLVIAGNGAKIVVADPSVGFLSLSVCHNVTVRDLAIDYDPKPNTQGTITAVDNASASVVVQLDPGNPSLLLPHFSTAPIRWALIKDAQYPRRQKPGRHSP